MTTHDRTTHRDLEARLRADAATWGGEPSPALLARLHVASRPTRWRVPLLAAAGVAIAAALALSWPRPRAQPPAGPRVDIARIEAMALQPLKQELASLVQDGRAVARGVWRQVPPQLRRLLQGGV